MIDFLLMVIQDIAPMEKDKIYRYIFTQRESQETTRGWCWLTSNGSFTMNESFHMTHTYIKNHPFLLQCNRPFVYYP